MRKIAILMLLAACAGEPPLEGIPDPIDDSKPLDSYDWTTPSEQDGIDPDSVPGKAEPGGVAIPFEAPGQPFAGPPRSFDGDKGTTSMLMGLGIRGNLHFQDGVCNEPDCGSQPDHCSYFGLECDDAWHYQARTLNMASRAVFGGEYAGSCAPAGGTDDGGAWAPCVFPNLTPSTRAWKYRLDINTCPSDATHRAALTSGLASLIAQTTNSSTGIGITWTQTTGSDWNLYVYCGTGGTEIASASARGNLTLKYGIAIAGGENLWVDDCTTPGWPGKPKANSPGWVAIQSQDMVYVAPKWEIRVNMANMIADSCTTDTTRQSWNYHNTLLHELGHIMGLSHDNLTFAFNQDFPVMRADATCASRTDRKFNLHPFYREAIKTLDLSTQGTLTVWDDDISCLKPFEY